MRWVTFRAPEGPVRVGVTDGQTVRALPAGSSLLELLVEGSLEQAGKSVQDEAADVFDLGQVRLLAPVPRPPSIRDGLCFLDHLRNSRRALGQSQTLEPVWEQTPAFYFANPTNVFGPYDDVPVAPGSAWFDLELEVGAVIGRAGRDLDPATAENHIAGYALLCDWSARDLQVREMQQGIGLAKAKDSGITLGPELVTVDELEPYRRNGRLAFELTAEVNGQTLTTGALAQMDWTFGELLAYASRGVELQPGDVFGSGTVPMGCLVEHLDAAPNQFTRWLKPGDEVVLRGQGLGETRQRVVASSAPRRLRTGF